MTWLITGGAGYIGAHVVQETLKSGRELVVLDDLSSRGAARRPSGNGSHMLRTVYELEMLIAHYY